MKSKQMDMLNGSLISKMILFAIPLALSSILQQLFNAADLAVVGRFDSSEAMAAVGSNSALIMLLVSLFTGLSVGANVLIASLIGKGKTNKINDAVHTVIAMALVSGVFLLIFGQFAAPALLRMMNTPEDVLVLAELYLRIYFLGMPFFMVYNFGAAILRSKGDSTRPLISLVAAGILNVILNLILVAGLHLGVTGVAIATDLSNGLNAGMILWFLMHEEENFRFRFRKLSLRKEYAVQVISVGAPAGLQGVVFSLSNVVIQSAINSFGAACIAGNTAAQNLEFMCYFMINAFAQTAVTFTSQNFAAGKSDRCKKIYLGCTGIGLGITFCLSIIFWIFRYPLMSIFTSDAAVVEYAMVRLQMVMLLEMLTGTYEISAGCTRGMGHSLQPAVLIIFGSCFVRLIWVATVFQAYRDIHVLMLVYPVTWIITGTLVTTSYFIIRRKEFLKIKRAA